MSVAVTEDVFARLIGRREPSGLLLFEIAAEFVDDVLDWSDPVQLRIVRSESGLVELQMRRVEVATP